MSADRPAGAAALDLARGWRASAEQLRRYGGPGGAATALDRCADELERAIAASDAELLTLGEASTLSGYSRDALRRMVREGKLANAGRRHAPRILRGQLPRKPAAAPVLRERPSGATVSAQTARAVVTSTGEAHDG